MIRMIKQAARLAGLCCVLLLPAHAQSDLREISGAVVDEHREPLSGAVVYLENEETQAVITYVTDRTGHYAFRRVSGAIDFQLWASFRGTLTKKHQLSKFDSAHEKKIELIVHLH